MDQPIPRRQLARALAGSTAAFATSCGSPLRGESRIVDDPALGRVYQWEKDDLLALVSGLLPGYSPGEEIRFKVLLNNQGGVPVLVKVRTKLIGRGQQVVVEAEVVSASVPAYGVADLERRLLLPRSLPPGDYTLQVELPPWALANTVGSFGGGAVDVPVRIAS